jgi:D-lyxose ketol-isomerase
LACTTRTIELVNTGKFGVRLRGKKRITIAQAMQDLRDKTVDLVKTKGCSVAEPFRAVAMTKWQERNPGKSAEEAGHLIKVIDLPDLGPTKRVLLRTLPEGEYDVTAKTNVAAERRERFASKDLAVREGQVDGMYHYLQKATGDVSNLGGKCNTLELGRCAAAEAGSSTPGGHWQRARHHRPGWQCRVVDVRL